jgi:hypothetical protein
MKKNNRNFSIFSFSLGTYFEKKYLARRKSVKEKFSSRKITRRVIIGADEFLNELTTVAFSGGYLTRQLELFL